MLELADLRIVRAQLADLLESDISPVLRERATIRGEVVHQEILALEKGLATSGKGGRFFKRFRNSVPLEMTRRRLLHFDRLP